MLRSLEGDRRLYISEFQTEEALILKVFDDSGTVVVQTVTICRMILMCLQVGNHGQRKTESWDAGLVFSVLAKRLAGKNASEMTYFVSSGV